MATMKFIVLAAACACAYAFPQDPTGPVTRNTIFAEEKFEGGAFEDLETMEQFHSRNDDPSSIYRLPNTTRPHHYNILWQIDMEALYMTGVVTIDLFPTVEGVNEIIIQTDNLTIGDISLYQGTTVVNTLPYVVDDELHFLRIPLANGSLVYNPTSPVYYSLTVPFSAPLRTNMYGIYRSWYRNNPSNLTEPVRWMATTQFQATAARYAFPCYDEPSFKATFDIVIRRPTHFKSWSLTRIDYTRNATFSGYQEDVYSTTPVMSTYLLAIIVAEYETKEFNDPTTGKLMYEVITRPGAYIANQSDYAYDVGMELLAEMSNHTDKDYYGVNANLKMTQASIPDFGAGAMENWGLLTYREAYLMYDEEHTNSYFKQLIAYILSHEIAHMWFGNLVTCDWWDVLWLNEGFARYYQYFLTDWVEDHMGFETRFIVEQVQTSLLTDSSNNPHPLSTSSIGSPATVSSMFSTLTYNKGAAVIRMTEHFLGFDVHREGLRNYLDQNAFQTVLPIDLFAALQNVSVVRGAISAYGPDFSVIDYYRSWTEQGGHPVLNVQVNHQTGEMVIYQRRFNINTGYSINNNNNYIVPISFATASNPNFNDTKPTHVISQAVTTIQRGSIGDEWVIFNKQQTGYYRVNYDDYTWDLIVLQLRGENRTQIHEYNRAQIVNDVFQFARSGLMSYTRAFNILSFLEFETDYAPWVAAITGFNWIRNRLVGTPYLAPLEEQIIRWSARAIARLTYLPIENEDFMDSYLRYQLAPTLCTMNVEDCRTNATAQFRALREQNVEVPVDSRSWVYCNALRSGSEADFDFLWNRFRHHNVYTEKIQLLMVLGCTPHQNSLKTFLDGIVSENFEIRPQDYTTAFNGAVTGNEANTQIVLQYIQANLTLVSNAFGSAATPLSYVSARLRTPEEITAFRTWANSSAENLGDAYQSVYSGAANSIYNLDYAAEIQSDLTNYFETGDQPVQLSSPAPVTEAPVSTVTPPTLVEPVTPDLQLPETGSAVTTYVSMLIIALAVVVNVIL